MKNLELKKELDNNPIDLKNNCFDIIRLIAAFQVMFGHFIDHFELFDNYTFFRFLRIVSNYILGCGVVIFFALSGYFSLMSLERNDYANYFFKKFVRIYPELWLAFLVNVVLIIILYGMGNTKDNIIFVFTQISFFQFYTGDWLRGYGVGTPNGALWTITVTIQFYILVYFLNMVSKKWKPLHWLLLLLICMVISILCSNLLFLPEIITKLLAVSVIPYFYIFLVGIIVYKYRDYILRYVSEYWNYIAVFYIFTKILLSSFSKNIALGVQYDVFSSCLLSLTVIGLGYAFSLKRLKVEMSYSLFLWHMIVCNVFIEIAEIKLLDLKDFGIVFFFASIFITLLCSFVSSLFGKKLLKRCVLK